MMIIIVMMITNIMMLVVKMLKMMFITIIMIMAMIAIKTTICICYLGSLETKKFLSGSASVHLFISSSLVV